MSLQSPFTFYVVVVFADRAIGRFGLLSVKHVMTLGGSGSIGVITLQNISTVTRNSIYSVSTKACYPGARALELITCPEKSERSKVNRHEDCIPVVNG